VSYAISLSGTTVSIASPGPRGVGVPTGGTTGQVLKKSSDTDYDFTWGTGAGIGNVVEDTTPQLGGNLDVNGNAIVSASNGDIAITPNGTGSIILDGLTWPSADGSAGQVLKTAGDGTLSFSDDTAGLDNVVEDTTPQLGGNLDVNGNAIVSASAGNIAITPDTTGRIVLDGFTWPDTDGTPNQVLKTNGFGTLSFGDASVVATSLDLTDTPGSYGTAGEVLALNSGATAFEFVANVASGAYTLDTLGTVAEGSITDVVALTATQYADIGTPDPNTLFVITDGTTSIADSDDVTITGTPSDHSFLVYDSATSDWINRTAAEAQADLGISAFGTTLIDDADAATARATLGANDASNLTTGTLSAARLPAITDSYVGHIETLADGTYYIDVRVPAGRTLTSFYIAADSGASATVDLQEGGVSMLSATASLTGGTPLEILTSATTPTISDTALAADAVLTIVLSGSSSGDNFRFAVEYTQ
jgi:hypothetical protein